MTQYGLASTVPVGKAAAILAAADDDGLDFGQAFEDALPRLIGTAAILAGFLVVWWMVKRVGRRVVERNLPSGEDHVSMERAQRLETLWTVARRMAAILLVVLFALTVLGIWGVPTGPVLAAGGVIGVALGFGAQSFVKDLIAGFFIVVENQYAVGDVVRIADIAGKVSDIRLRTTVLRDLDGYVHHIPNGEITTTTNYTAEYAAVVADIGIAYGEEVDRALEVLTDEAARFYEDEEWSMHFLEEPKTLGVDKLADWSVVIRIILTTLPDSRWMVKREFYRRVKNRLDAEGIEIPFPYTTVHPSDGWRSLQRGEASAGSPREDTAGFDETAAEEQDEAAEPAPGEDRW